MNHTFYYSVAAILSMVVFSLVIFWFFSYFKNEAVKNKNKNKNNDFVTSFVTSMDIALQLVAKEKEVEDLKKQKDAVYKERNILVALLTRTYPSGIKKTAIEGWSPEWHNCVYIELPDGSQCSWHYHDRDCYLFEDLPAYEKDWDGHTTKNKYFNIEELIASGCLTKTN